MNSGLDDAYRPLLEAVAFAARAHRHQQRKDGQTPYVSHVFRVCLVLRHVFGVEDPQALQAAALHDTVEDTNTDFDDLRKQFGATVAEWVALLTKDKRLEETQREAVYINGFVNAAWQVQVCKLADIFDNLMDTVNISPEQRQRSLNRSAQYLAALQPKLHEQARRPFEMVAQLLAERRARVAQ